MAAAYRISLCRIVSLLFITSTAMSPSHNISLKCTCRQLSPDKEKRVNCEWNFKCQHGPKECKGNLMEVCVLNYVQDHAKQLKFIHCVETSDVPEDSGDKKKSNMVTTVTSPIESIDVAQIKCLKQIGMEHILPTVHECESSTLASDLEHIMGVKTSEAKTSKFFIPWIVVDGLIFFFEFLEELEELVIEKLSDVSWG
ncbi:Gamma-interferon-inducible-lysosomal thiol reductase [Nymphon striatum]|nr:Gamma-interferon-inducible-lysosomal thiol reductase [Nymphon striatum]